MPFKKHTPEEITCKLREAEIVLAQGRTKAPVSNTLHSVPAFSRDFCGERRTEPVSRQP
jgi:hypothetical protein